MRFRRVSAVAMVVLFGTFIWPTPYRYFPGPGLPILGVRLNRFTGSADWLTPSGWRAIPGADSASQPMLAFALVVIFILGAALIASTAWRWIVRTANRRATPTAPNHGADGEPPTAPGASDTGRADIAAARRRPFYRVRRFIAILVNPRLIDQFPPFISDSDQRELHELVHTLWSRDVAAGYSKDQWKRLTNLLYKLVGFR